MTLRELSKELKRIEKAWPQVADEPVEVFSMRNGKRTGIEGVAIGMRGSQIVTHRDAKIES